MKPRPSAWVFALLLAAVVTLWLRFQPLSPDVSGYVLEMDLASTASGETWLRYDLGRGLSERDQRIFTVTESAQPRTYRVTLPSGAFRCFAIVPPVSVHDTLASARILSPDGSVAARIPAVRDLAEQHVISFRSEHPLPLFSPDAPTWLESAAEFILCAGAVLLVGELVRRRADPARWRKRADLAARWATAHPGTTIIAAAALAVAMSCYPVVFFGQSFVSPNN